ITDLRSEFARQLHGGIDSDDWLGITQQRERQSLSAYHIALHPRFARLVVTAQMSALLQIFGR
ncbi:MAG: hypothetical protein ACRDU4_20765, partial [Mycobacterium sp.]